MFVMKKLLIIAAASVALFATSCITVVPIGATNNKIEKTGIAERTIWFGLAFGHTDLSIQTAAKNGSITKIATVDYGYRNGLFKDTYRTIVSGN